jgi:hypothetical protein
MSIFSNDAASHPAPITPPYPLGQKDEPILLYEGSLELVDNANADLIASGRGKVEFHWLPTPHAVYTLPSRRDVYEFPSSVSLRSLDGVVDAEGVVSTHQLGGGPMSGSINTSSLPEQATTTEVRFFVANLREFFGEPLYEEWQAEDGHTQRSAWAGRVVLTDDVWRFTIDRRRDFEVVKLRLAAEGGVAVTHMGSLVRFNGTTFSAAEADDALVALSGFLGLARGQWAPPLLPRGLNANGDIVWQDWTQRNTSSWSGVMSPFDILHREHLQSGFAGYMTRWRDPLWNQPLRFATHMYVEANGPVTADTSLVLAQAALELIAWVLFVEEKRTHDERSFDKIWASERLRELLAWMGMTPAIPATLANLASEARRLDWADGPHVISEMRNALVHPRKREMLNMPSMAARIELYQMALSYLELALLRLIDFNGEYTNRLASPSVGIVERVPWIASPVSVPEQQPTHT